MFAISPRVFLRAVLWLAFGLGALQQDALAGGMSSNGGEIITYQSNPWFIGAKPVRYCIMLTLHELGHVFGIDHGVGRVMDRDFSEDQADRALENRDLDEQENIYKLPPDLRLNLTRDIQLRNFDATPVRACNSTLDLRGFPIALEILKRDRLPAGSVLCFESINPTQANSHTEWFLRLYDTHPIASEARLLQSVTLRGADQLAMATTVGSPIISGRYPEANGYWSWRSFATIWSPRAEQHVSSRHGQLFYLANADAGAMIELQFAHLGHISKIHFDLGALDFLSRIK